MQPDTSSPDRATAHTPIGLAPRIATLIVVLLPFAGLIAAVVLLWGTQFHGLYLALLGVMYLLTGLGIGIGYHRLFTHHSFETSRPVRFFWGVLGSMAIEGSLLTWVALHRQHHQHSDVAGDPHSPHAGAHDDDDHPSGVLGVLRGAWHAHMGWLFRSERPNLPRYVPDLQKDPVAAFVDRTFVLWCVLGLLIPAVLGGLLTRSWMGVLLGFLWGGLVRVLLVHHVTWSINSICHLWGTRPFKTRDQSRDNPILGLLALGEGWHNTHHAFPTSARHGLSWWKLDINYLVIRGMALLGLVRNVRVPSRERIRERQRE